MGLQRGEATRSQRIRRCTGSERRASVPDAGPGAKRSGAFLLLPAAEAKRTLKPLAPGSSLLRTMIPRG
jgi:hypothetical protein